MTEREAADGIAPRPPSDRAEWNTWMLSGCSLARWAGAGDCLLSWWRRGSTALLGGTYSIPASNQWSTAWRPATDRQTDVQTDWQRLTRAELPHDSLDTLWADGGTRVRHLLWVKVKTLEWPDSGEWYGQQTDGRVRDVERTQTLQLRDGGRQLRQLVVCQTKTMKLVASAMLSQSNRLIAPLTGEVERL